MDHSVLTKLLDAIEAELRRLRYLVGDPARITSVSSVFGYGQVSFEQWLGQVFLPNARAAITANNLPHSSQVAAAAVRNLDGAEVDTLLELLCTFDAKINQLGGIASGIPRGA
jgi:uncharacterized protein YqcC (DUF446 family)